MADVSPEAHPSSAADTLTRYSCAALVLSDSSAGCQLLRTFSPCPRFGCAAASEILADDIAKNAYFELLGNFAPFRTFGGGALVPICPRFYRGGGAKSLI